MPRQSFSVIPGFIPGTHWPFRSLSIVTTLPLWEGLKIRQDF